MKILPFLYWVRTQDILFDAVEYQQRCRETLLSMCCTESYGAHWDKDVKHASPGIERVSRNLRGYSTASKSISCARTQYEKGNFFVRCCVWQKFSSALSYTSRTYAEAMAMCPAVTYTPYATSSKEQTGDVITFAHFEGENLLTETCNNTESGDESDS